MSTGDVNLAGRADTLEPVSILNLDKVQIAKDIAILQQRKRDIDAEIRRLLIISGAYNPQWECFRCGWAWIGHNIVTPPKYCPRCHTANWNIPPSGKRDRYPDMPPAKSWRQGLAPRKKRGRPRKVRPEPQVALAALPPTIVRPVDPAIWPVKTNLDVDAVIVPAYPDRLPPPPPLSGSLREELAQVMQRPQVEEVMPSAPHRTGEAEVAGEPHPVEETREQDDDDPSYANNGWTDQT